MCVCTANAKGLSSPFYANNRAHIEFLCDQRAAVNALAAKQLDKRAVGFGFRFNAQGVAAKPNDVTLANFCYGKVGHFVLSSVWRFDAVKLPNP
jgi:hypothetical protein